MASQYYKKIPSLSVFSIKFSDCWQLHAQVLQLRIHFGSCCWWFHIHFFNLSAYALDFWKTFKPLISALMTVSWLELEQPVELIENILVQPLRFIKKSTGTRDELTDVEIYLSFFLILQNSAEASRAIWLKMPIIDFFSRSVKFSPTTIWSPKNSRPKSWPKGGKPIRKRLNCPCPDGAVGRTKSPKVGVKSDEGRWTRSNSESKFLKLKTLWRRTTGKNFGANDKI